MPPPEPARRRSRAVAPAPLHIAAVAGLSLPALVLSTLGLLADPAWYDEIARPTFAPPAWLLAGVSALVIALLAGALWRVLRRPDYVPDRRGAIRLLTLLMVLAALWPWALFGLHMPPAALGLLAVVCVLAAAALVWLAAVDGRALALAVAPTLWFVFLALTCLSITILNVGRDL